jgi:hypothetical protein
LAYLDKYGPSSVDIKTISLNDLFPTFVHRITVGMDGKFWIDDTPRGDNCSQGYGALAANEFLLLSQKYGARRTLGGTIGFSETYRHRQIPFYRKLGFEVKENLRFHLDLATYKPIENIDQEFITKRIKWYEDKDHQRHSTEKRYATIKEVPPKHFLGFLSKWMKRVSFS